MFTLKSRLFLLIAILMTISGCAGSGLRIAGREGALEENAIYDLRTGQKLTLQELVGKLSGVRVIFIGEQHIHKGQHGNQLELLKALHEMDPKLALGLEVFPKTSQELLDLWIEGKLTEGEFSRRVVEDVLNIQTLDVYFPILDYARRVGMPLLALNAPRSITGKVARGGLAGLTSEERARIPDELVIGPDEYRERVSQAFAGHAGHVDLDNFFAAQVIWDETMAQTAADFLSSPKGMTYRLVVICGNEHVFRRHGIPARLARRNDSPQAVLLCPITTENDSLGPSEADYLWATPPEKPMKRPRLGVSLEKDLTVISTAPESEAERIGLQPGDRLLEMDGQVLETVMDLHRAAVGKEPNAVHTLTV